MNQTEQTDTMNLVNGINSAQTLTDHQKDAIGEVGNICMGTSATTLSQLLGKRVTITTPKVSVVRGNGYLNEYERPVVATEVSYTKGLDGINIFLIKKEDALAITEVLMGTTAGADELYLSAISEVMNQMVGSSSTALANLLHVDVNISPPVIRELTPASVDAEQSDELLIKTSFLLEIEGLLKSDILQIMNFDFGKKLATSLMGEEPEVQPQPQPAPNPAMPQPHYQTAAPSPAMPLNQIEDVQTMLNQNSQEKVELKAVKFQSFDDRSGDHSVISSQYGQTNIDLIIDVPLHVTVVLGKTKKSIKEILEFNRGSVIVLDRLAGEMVDVLVNGKQFARGEVVVIEDNYGVRITEITSPDHVKNE